ncbi:peptide/nickel transport system permease protein [Murinocardiopsis flavida]|uniref:Peptide/nickel transport system permease protein n=1 Tax=Murinocardiopsis flavida TaxID=645275 RepID=A0A2P8DSY0_9ACTN|nr:ABC transporter permease [Murinocardiopsis flavida]PSL00329.1 peptide/nickel transport system permease protein [Murinocardiopsis flavida]
MNAITTRPWPAFLLRKAAELLLAMVALVVITFAIAHLIPGDAARVVAGVDATAEQVEDTRARLGLDRPLAAQFWDYLSGVLTADLGESFRTGQPVSEVIANRLPFTASIALFGIALTLGVSLALGLAVAGLTRGNRNPWLDSAFGWATGVVLALPVYVIGAVLIVVFAVNWGVLPAAGADSLYSYVLPTIAIALGPIASMSRLVRREAAVVLEQDYMRTARGRRISTFRQYAKHAVPNLLASTLTLSGLILAGMIGGAIIIESVFAWPGLGRAVVDSIIERDYPMTRGIILTVGAVAVALNTAIDIILALVDPRTLRAGKVLA